MTERRDPTAAPEGPDLGWTAGIVRLFLGSNLSALFLIFSVIAGSLALLWTPREEDPQFVVAVVDVFVQMPGADAAEIERLVAGPFEAILAEIPGVEHVYSTASPGALLISARFFVGEDRERSITKVFTAIEQNRHRVPLGVAGWQVRPLDFDRVPIITVGLVSKTLEVDALREVALEVVADLRSVPNVGETGVVGGAAREVRFVLDPARLAAHGLTPLEVLRAVRGANVKTEAGALTAGDRETSVRVGRFLQDAEDLRNLVVGVAWDPDGRPRPVYARDVGEVFESTAEPETYTRFGFGPAAAQLRDLPAGFDGEREYPSVTVTVAKRRGTNAVTVARDVLTRLDGLRGTVIPSQVEARLIRNFGNSANEKVHELISHLGFAIIGVLALVGFALGWREALVVALAVPVTLALTVAAGGTLGYSINRVSLFALILSLGLLVDDPIVDVENIHRHFRRREHPPFLATLLAVDEVRPPTVLATFAVVVSFLPLYSVGGLLGIYMEPMAFNVPVAMVVSLIVAFTITPWASYRFLQPDEHDDEPIRDVKETVAYRRLRRVLMPLLRDRWKGTLFLTLVGVGLMFSLVLIPLGLVPVKLLPFDNKDELLLVVDAPEGTPLERTDAVLRELGTYVRSMPEVRTYQSYAGTSSPIDLNGLVRRYFLRSGGHVGELRVNFVHKLDRKTALHQIAIRMQPAVAKIGERAGMIVKVVEIPPGPPVLAGLVAEIHGPPQVRNEDLEVATHAVMDAMRKLPYLAEIDSSLEAERERLEIIVDRAKAALHGISDQEIAETLRMAIAGGVAGSIVEAGREERPIRLRMPEAFRADSVPIAAIQMRDRSGRAVPLGELVRFERVPSEQPLQRKDRERVVYVTAESLGCAPVEAVFRARSVLDAALPPGMRIDWWGDGEWQVTFDSLRGLGRAFGLSLVTIYVLLVGQTGSLGLPLIIMLAIPLTLIGVVPGFWLLNVFFSAHVNGVLDPFFLTGPVLTGLIALSGIVVRNSIILLDFIAVLLERDVPLNEAIVEAVATRLRPILLTAGASVLGAWIIVLDPIFSGLAWSIVFGLIASTTLTLGVVPVVYARIAGRGAKNVPAGAPG